jgi:uncharacterized protein YfiM (DUF2279 family)
MVSRSGISRCSELRGNQARANWVFDVKRSDNAGQRIPRFNTKRAINRPAFEDFMREQNGSWAGMSALLCPRFTIGKLIYGRLLFLSTIAIGISAPWNTLVAADKPQRATGLQVAARDVAEAQGLMNQIAALSPRVRAEEAAQLSACVYNTARQLRRDYQVVWPPLFNNVLVNSGIKKRGLCFQWAEDLLIRLDALKLRSLELHWGEAQAGTSHENNSIIITAMGQPFNRGILVDCWRHSGNVYWSRVVSDRFLWSENSAYAGFVRAKSAAAANHHVALEKKIERQRKTTGALVKASADAH